MTSKDAHHATIQGSNGHPDEAEFRTFIPDEAAHKDDLGFDPYVQGLANLISAPGTATPLTLGILGGWGSGKTSLMELLRAELQRRSLDHASGKHTLWINVWQLSPRGDIGRSFLQAVLTQTRRELGLRERVIFSWYLLRRRLDTAATGRQLAANSYRLLVVALAVVFAARASSSTPGLVDPIVGGLASLVLGLWLIVKPVAEAAKDKLSLDLGTLLRKAPYEMQISVLQRLRDDFEKLISLWIGKSGRLVVFVDDLDRCPLEAIPGLLEAIKLFMMSPGCVYVLAADSDVISQGIQLRLNAGAVAAGVEARVPEGKRYLEKIVQLPFELPLVGMEAIQDYITSLRAQWPDGEGRCGEIFAFGLPPNPRRIKRAVNVFLLLWELAERRRAIVYERDANADRRGDATHTAEVSLTPLRLAKVVVIQTEYPAVFEQLKAEPTLLRQLESACRGTANLALPASLAAAATVESMKKIFLFPLPRADSAQQDGKDLERAHFSGLSSAELEAFFSLAGRVASEPQPVLEIDELIQQYRRIRID